MEHVAKNLDKRRLSGPLSADDSGQSWAEVHVDVVVKAPLDLYVLQARPCRDYRGYELDRRDMAPLRLQCGREADTRLRH